MYALKMLGLAVLAALCAGIFFVSYGYFQGMSTSQEVREEASTLHEEVEEAIITGRRKEVSIEVPSGYTFEFESNRLVADGIVFPEGGDYDFPVQGPSLEPGKYYLVIRVLENSVVVEVG